VTCSDGAWQIVQGREISEFSQEKMAATEAELIEERDSVAHLLPG
jgi:malate dehydrogenase